MSIERLGETRRSLLEALRAIGGEGNTSEILQATAAEVPEGSRGYHFRWLEGEGLIVEVDRQEVSHGGKDVVVWGITEDGEQLLEEIDALEDRGDRPQTIEGLNDRIDELESEVSNLKDVVWTALDEDLRQIISEEVEKELEHRDG